MGAQVCQGAKVDRDLDPQTILRRNKLFREHVLPFENMIYFLCIQYATNKERVPEYYNEVLVNFYRMIESYNPEKPIRTWLHIVTKRFIWSLERKKKSAIQISDDLDIEDLDDREEGPLAEDRVSGNCMGIENYREMYNDDILSVLDELKPCFKDAFLLQEAGYSLKEIAEIEHKKGTLKSKNIETVKSRLRIARQHLKSNLTRDGDRIPNTTNPQAGRPDIESADPPRL